jgi:PAS domain S-box-containing protein
MKSVNKKEKRGFSKEECYSNIFNTISEAIYILKEDGIFIDVNKGAVEMYGYSREEFIGKTPADISAPGKNDLKKTFLFLKEAFKNKSQKFEFWGQRKNGETFPKEVILNKGIYLGKDVIIATARDITESKKQMEKLKHYASELNNLNTSKDKFFSIIAHDLRNPFNGLLGFSTVLLEELHELTPAEIKEYAGYIHTSAKTVYNLVDNLLQWSRIQTGRIDYQPIKIDLYEEVYKTAELFNSNAITKRIKLINNIQTNAFVFADQNMLRSILQNLISNGIKFTRFGGSVKISSKEKDENIQIEITDTGIGIEMKDISKLFRIDSQFSNLGTSNEEGTGLGLILSKELVEKNNGQIWVKSTINKGTTFFFTLPKWEFAD